MRDSYGSDRQVWPIGNTHPMVPQIFDSIMTGWWYTYPSEQWKSVGIIIPNWMEKKNVPNHQPDEIVFIF